jgi:hypothetical protein
MCAREPSQSEKPPNMNAHRQPQTLTRQMRSGLKFLVNYQLKQLRQNQRREKINGSISLFMEVKVLGTHSRDKNPACFQPD